MFPGRSILLSLASTARQVPAWVHGVALLALPVTLYGWQLERAELVRLEKAARQAAAAGPLSEQAQERIDQWGKSRQGGEQAAQRLRSALEEPSLWQPREIAFESQRMSRVEADQYLKDLASGTRSLFLPSTVYIRAAEPRESVFAPHQGLDKAGSLLVTVKGRLYTREAE